MAMLLVPSSMSFMILEATGQQDLFGHRGTVCSIFDRLCDEKPEHYVERYITEPEYKAWFDRNFPDYTIYEGIGITESQYQEIVNDLTKPQPASEQKTTTTKESSGNEIIYALVAAVVIGGSIGAFFFIRKGSKEPTAQKKPSSRRKRTVSLCTNCGKPLRPKAKFCGKCGSARS